MRDASGTRSQSDDRAVRARIADRTRHVRAGGKPDFSGRHRGRRAARRTAARQPHIPWVARRSEHVVDGIAAGTELRRVRFADDDCAVRFQSLNDDIGVGRNPIGIDARTVGPSYSLHRCQVFHHDRQPVKAYRIAVVRPSLFHDLACVLARAVEAADRNSVDGGVDRFDPGFCHIEQFEWADLTATKHGHRLARGKLPKIAHLSSRNVCESDCRIPEQPRQALTLTSNAPHSNLCRLIRRTANMPTYAERAFQKTASRADCLWRDRSNISRSSALRRALNRRRNSFAIRPEVVSVQTKSKQSFSSTG